jgi:hypothetical protein
VKEGLKIRWTRDDHFQVENLYVFECETPDQMREMFFLGVKEKVMGSHHMNVQSSRSHCLFTIYVHVWDPSSPECVVKAELTLVDLAGSEKLALLSQDPSPQLLKESIEINTSLLSLGKVITALGSNVRNAAHIPYRDSKLTKLLKHALGGNSMTAMIACISPLDAYIEESTSTLLYAGRARNITNAPRINEDPRSALIRQLREEILSLRAELEYYRQLATKGSVDEKLLPKSLIETSERQKAHATVVPPEESDLAEKLLESCKMLKNVMSVNSQLRQAFEKLKAAKDEATQREVELNAENIALRERIEMLESITLSEESGTAPSTTAKGAASAVLKNAEQRGSVRHSQSSPQLLESERPEGPSAGSKLQFGDRLKDYANKYRNPQKPTSYEDYYGKARTKVNSKDPTGIQDLERLLRNAPRSTQSTVPVSLQSAHAFGSLSFGGTDEETRGLEERRRQRQLRLAQLQEHHNHMQRGFSGGVASTVSAPAALASSAPPFSWNEPSASSSSRLFAYLSQDETTRVFSAEQLDRLKQRPPQATTPAAAAQTTPRNKTQIESHRGGVSALAQLQQQLDALDFQRRSSR